MPPERHPLITVNKLLRQATAPTPYLLRQTRGEPSVVDATHLLKVFEAAYVRG